jgi:AcrR family transcriptional regulator
MTAETPERIDGRRLRYQHRRGELIEAVGEYVLDHGIASLTLRGVAQDVGVSHATLQHHFGTKEQLVEEIVEHLLKRTLVPEQDRAGGDPEARVRELWRHWTSEVGQRDIRLFIEIVGQSLFDQSGYTATMQRSMDSRLGALAASFVGFGCPAPDAAAVATLMLAQLRGLMTDLLVTGDRPRIDAAFELLLENSRRRVAGWIAPPADALHAVAVGARV